MDKTPAPRVGTGLVTLAATLGATVTTLVLTAGPAAAASINHNENAVLDQ